MCSSYYCKMALVYISSGEMSFSFTASSSSSVQHVLGRPTPAHRVCEREDVCRKMCMWLYNQLSFCSNVFLLAAL